MPTTLSVSSSRPSFRCTVRGVGTCYPTWTRTLSERRVRMETQLLLTDASRVMVPPPFRPPAPPLAGELECQVCGTVCLHDMCLSCRGRVAAYEGGGTTY